MKKLLLSAFALLSLGFSASAIDWTAVDNYAKNKPVVGSSNSINAASITDGNNGSRWQAIPAAKNDEDYQDWILIDFEQEVTITDIDIYWEASRMSRYSVYFTNDEVKYSDKEMDDFSYFIIDKDFFTNNVPVYEGSVEGENGNVHSEIEIEPTKGRYLLIYGLEYNSNGITYGASIFEVMATFIEDKNQISAISIPNLHIIEGNTSSIDISLLNSANELITNFEDVETFSLSCSDLEAISLSEINDNSFSLFANKKGSFTLQAKVVLNSGEEFTAESILTITTDWSKTDNIASGKAILARKKDIETNEHSYEFATDENLETYYEYNGDWGGGNSWVIVDLGVDCVVNYIEIQWGNKSNGTYSISTALDGVSISEIAIDEGWSNGKYSDWTDIKTTLYRNNNERCIYIFDTPILARYIAVRDLDNPGGKPQYSEIYAAGTKYTDSTPTTIQLESSNNFVSNDETLTFTTKVLDQHSMLMEISEGFSYFLDNEELNGLNGNIINVEAPEKNGEYVYSVRYGNLYAECIINVFGDNNNLLSKGENAIQYSLSIDNESLSSDRTLENLKEQIIKENSVFEIDLNNLVYDFDLIKIRWEAASPADYTVRAVYYDKTEDIILSVEGRTIVMNYNPIDRIINSKNTRSVKRRANSSTNIDGITKIQIIPTKNNNNQWDMKLLGIDLYGAKSDISTYVEGINNIDNLVDIYTLTGVKVASRANYNNVKTSLAPGIYIVNGKKVVIK